MKFFCPLLTAMCLLAGATRGRAESINGQSYVSLAGWARANGFAGYTLNRGEEIILTNKTSRLVFDTDSAEAQINGVNVRLSYPVAKGGLISQLDADKTHPPAGLSAKAIREKNHDHLPRPRPRRQGHRLPRGLVVSAQRKNLHAGARAGTAAAIAAGRLQCPPHARKRHLS